MKRKSGLWLMLAVLALSSAFLQACGTNSGGSSGSSLTSLEAQKLAYKKASQVFDDPVLWRMAPIADRDATELGLDSKWQDNDRSACWFFWYAEPGGEDWFMIGIKGEEIVYSDIGTRGSAMPMDAAWARESTEISLKAAAAAARKSGADLESLTFAEYNVKQYIGSKLTPAWVLTFSQSLDSGLNLNYRMFVDPVTGKVLMALNDRNEDLSLPLDLKSLGEKKSETHEADLRGFFSSIDKGDAAAAVRQLSHGMCPNETMAELWLESFESIDGVVVGSVVQYNLENWTSEREYYKVTLEIDTHAAEESFGWKDGRNIRWITLIPQGAGYWKVDAIANSP